MLQNGLTVTTTSGLSNNRTDLRPGETGGSHGAGAVYIVAQTLMWLCDWSLEIERVQWLLERVQVREGTGQRGGGTGWCPGASGH